MLAWREGSGGNNGFITLQKMSGAVHCTGSVALEVLAALWLGSWVSRAEGKCRCEMKSRQCTATREKEKAVELLREMSQLDANAGDSAVKQK